MSDGEESDEDDWFERALREEDTSETDDRTGEDADPSSGPEVDRDPEPDSDPATDPEQDGPLAGGAEDSFEGSKDPFDKGSEDPFGEGSDGPLGEGFEDSFDDGAERPLGEGTDGHPGGGLFDEGFDEAMGSVGGETEDFDGEDFESDIPRIDLGVRGLDNMIQGGVPLRHLMVVIGGAGTGKTTFGLQFIQHGLRKEDTDKGVFITLEQTHEDIMATAGERGWEFERHEREGNLAVVDLDPVEMANSLDNIRNELPDLIEDFGADRFVLDSVSLLEMMYDDVARRRTEVFDFTQSLKKAGVTTVLTSEADEDNPYVSRHGIIEYLTDAVFLLRYVRSETQETRLAVEIQKIRNANHSRATKPYEITLDGISVYEQANIF